MWRNERFSFKFTNHFLLLTGWSLQIILAWKTRICKNGSEVWSHHYPIRICWGRWHIRSKNTLPYSLQSHLTFEIKQTNFQFHPQVNLFHVNHHYLILSSTWFPANHRLQRHEKNPFPRPIDEWIQWRENKLEVYLFGNIMTFVIIFTHQFDEY